MKYHKIFCTVIFFFSLVSISLSQEALIFKPDLRSAHLPFGLTNKVKAEKPVIALVLSGGGARGAAQVGVLKALVEENIEFEIIVGTSIGSIVGGLYSVGYTVNQLDSIIKNSNWEEITSLQERRRSNLFVEQKVTEDRNLFSLRLDGLTPIIPTSLSNGNKILNFLNLLTLKAPIVSKNFDNYLKKFRAVCTDLKTGKAATLDHGNLAEVMRASSSVSFFLKPLEIDDMLLADGGLVANIPVAEAKKAGADFIIAVNTTSPLREYQELEKPWFLADQVVSIPMKQLENRDLELADVVISPDLDHASNDFSGLDSLIDIGYRTAKNIIPEIKKLISQKTKSVITADSILQISSSSFAGARYYQEFDALNKKTLKISEIKNVLNTIYNKYGLEPVIEIRNHGNESVLFYYEIKEKNIDEIKLNGVPLNNFDFEKKYFETLLNKPYNTFSLSNSLVELLRAYRTDQKYLIYPKIIQFDNSSGVLRIDLSSDMVDTISITGNRKTNESVIRREIALTQNELFNPVSVSQTFNNLNGTNLFELYSFDVSNNLLTNHLSLKILEKNSGIIRIGIRADNERNAQLGLDIRDENFLGYAYEIGFTFLGGLRNRTFSFENRANRLFNSVFTYELELFHTLIDKYVYQNAPETSIQNWDRVQSGEYKTIKYGLRFSVGAQIEKLGNLYVDFKRYKAEVTPLKNAVDKNFNNNLFTFKFGALFDSRDRYPFPLEGILMNTYYETSQRFLGGELGYSKIFFQYEAFFSYFKRHTLHPRFIFGFGDETLPLFDQFFLGGQNSFMGLNEDDLYGRQIFLASLEYRIFLPFKIFFDTYLNVRYDLGGAWLTPSAVRYVELRHGLGVGLSLDTPIGAANFAIGRGFFIRNDILKKPLSFGPYMFYFELGYPI